MQFVFADEIVCKMTTVIEDNSQSDLGPADGPANVHLAVAATGTALHPTGKQLIVCGTLSLQLYFPSAPLGDLSVATIYLWLKTLLKSSAQSNISQILHFWGEFIMLY